MVKLSIPFRHAIKHTELAIVLSMIVLKTTNYWIHTGGSEYLPEIWVFYNQHIEHTYQGGLALLGVFCSFLLGSSLTPSKKQNVLWYCISGLLWIMLCFVSSPFEKMLLSICLCTITSVNIVSQLLTKKTNHVIQKSRTPAGSKKAPSANIPNSSFTNPPCDLDLSKLDIGTPGKCATPKSSPIIRSSGFTKPRPLISPSRFSSSNYSESYGNLTKASWVAGGYWQSNTWPSSPSFSSPSPSHQPTTRSSSQSSGFGSIQLSPLNRSPPDSRPDSQIEEIDRVSVFSDEPRYADCSSNPYNYTNDLARKSMISPISSVNGSVHHMSVNPVNSQWSWLPFMFGFSLAVNMCALTYLVFVHCSKH